jgi:hypothetical protein
MDRWFPSFPRLLATDIFTLLIWFSIVDTSCLRPERSNHHWVPRALPASILKIDTEQIVCRRESC